jgi:CHAT domain-containing protein
MTDFYRQLSQGSTKAEAIRYAQSRMIASNTYAHPFYWACFALYGNPW